MKNGIVIPCYNEGQRLNTEAFMNFVRKNPDYNLCFVNDGSKDNTLEVLNHMAEECPFRIHVVDLKANSGKAEAVRSGMRYLYNESDVDTIGYLDADLATGFSDYQNMVNQFIFNGSKLEMVFGSRKLSTEGIERSFFRNLVSNVIGLIISFIVRMQIKDTQCGAKVFRRRMIPKLFEDGFTSRWLFDVELFVRLRRALGKQEAMAVIQEYALSDWKDVEGSKITLADSIKFPKQLLKITNRYELRPVMNGISMRVAATLTFIVGAFIPQ